MTESVAMMMHVSDCHPESGLMPDVGQTGRAIAYRWLVFSTVNLYEAGCRIVDTHHYSANKSDYEGIRAKARHDLDQYWETGGISRSSNIAIKLVGCMKVSTPRVRNWL
jgi:glutathione S-transferase